MLAMLGSCSGPAGLKPAEADQFERRHLAKSLQEVFCPASALSVLQPEAR